MIILALIFAGISLWAILGAASVGLWLITTILSIVFGIIWFVVRHTVHIFFRLAGLVIIIGAIGVGLVYVLPLI